MISCVAGFAEPVLTDESVVVVKSAADVQHDVQIHVGLGIVLFHVESLLPSIQLPVDMPQIIALSVFPMRIELDTESHKRTAMQSMHKTFHNPVSTQLEAIELREQSRGRECFKCGGHQVFGFRFSDNSATLRIFRHRVYPGGLPACALRTSQPRLG